MATQRAQEAKAKETTPQASAQPASTAAGQTTPETGTDAGSDKQKPERLFGGNSNFAALKKAQSEVDQKYNRIGRKLKGLELDEEDMKAIVEILKKSHSKASQEAFAKATAGASNEGTEQFV